MVPFTFLTEQDRWNIAFFAPRSATPRSPSSPPSSPCLELAATTDGALLDDLYAAGFPSAPSPVSSPLRTALPASPPPPLAGSAPRPAFKPPSPSRPPSSSSSGQPPSSPRRRRPPRLLALTASSR
ncbi:MAG: hypothetical protein R3F14_18160 [Polyangiaceae bacterium]